MLKSYLLSSALACVAVSPAFADDLHKAYIGSGGAFVLNDKVGLALYKSGDTAILAVLKLENQSEDVPFGGITVTGPTYADVKHPDQKWHFDNKGILSTWFYVLKTDATGAWRLSEMASRTDYTPEAANSLAPCPPDSAKK